jgi:hypothetical protein
MIRSRVTIYLVELTRQQKPHKHISTTCKQAVAHATKLAFDMLLVATWSMARSRPAKSHIHMQSPLAPQNS